MSKETQERYETSEDIQRAIDELNAEKLKLELAEQADAEAEMIEMPLASIMVRINKNTTVLLNKVTPAEALVLVAEHHKASGGNPLEKITPATDANGNPVRIKVDPIELRGVLANKYSGEKIMALFPGLMPQFPKTFSQALRLGIGAKLPENKLMSHDLATSN